MKYFDYAKESFEYPILNNEKKLYPRASSPLELFFDLIFVALFAVIGHQFIHLTLISGILAFTLFVALFFIWSNINMFMMRFYHSSYYLRIGIMLAMLPMFLIATVDDMMNPRGIMSLGTGLLLSWIILIILWYMMTFKNKNITNVTFKKMIRIDLMGYMLYALIAIAPLVVPNVYVLIVSIWSGIFIEILFVSFQYRRYQLHENQMPQIDLTLLNERFLLFIILIFGEGVLSSFSLFNEQSSHYFSSLGLSIIVFLSIFLFYLRVYEEATVRRFLPEFSMMYMLYLAGVGFLQLSLYSTMNAMLTYNGDVSYALRVMLMINLFGIALLHMYGDIRDLRNTSLSTEERKFAIVDIITLIPMLLLSLLPLGITSRVIIVCIVFAYFVIHIIPVPYRYEIFKKELFETKHI